MAVGIAEGFTRGFGLVSEQFKDRRDRELREKELRDKAADRAESRLYRERQLDQTNRQIGLQEDRLANQISNQKAADLRADEETEYQRNQDEIAAARQAKKDALDQRRVEAQIGASEEQRRERDLASQKREKEIQEIEAAQNLSRAVKAWRTGDLEAFRTHILHESLADDKNYMNIRRLLNPENKEQIEKFHSEVQTIIENNGSFKDLSATALSAIESAVNIGGSNAVGKAINSTFKNAPEGLKGYTVEEISLLELDHKDTVDAQGNVTEQGITARLSVKYSWTDETGTKREGYYYPMMTDYRDPSSTKAATITIDDAFKAMAGDAYLKKSIMEEPNFRQAAEGELITNNERIKKSYESIMESLETALRNADGSSSAENVLGDFDGRSDMTAEELLQNTAELEALARKIAIYGTSRSKRISQARERYEQTKEQVMGIPMPWTQNAIKNTKIGTPTKWGEPKQNMPTIRDLLVDEADLDPGAIGQINARIAGGQPTQAELQDVFEWLRNNRNSLLRSQFQK